MPHPSIASRRVWIGQHADLRLVRVHIRARALGPELTALAWEAVEAAARRRHLAVDGDYGQNQSAFLADAEDALADAIADAIATVAETAGVEPGDIGEVVDEALPWSPGIHRFGDRRAGLVIVAVDDVDDGEVLVVEDTQRLTS